MYNPALRAEEVLLRAKKVYRQDKQLDRRRHAPEQAFGVQDVARLRHKDNPGKLAKKPAPELLP
jgi:hypothetical protein